MEAAEHHGRLICCDMQSVEAAALCVLGPSIMISGPGQCKVPCIAHMCEDFSSR